MRPGTAVQAAAAQQSQNQRLEGKCQAAATPARSPTQPAWSSQQGAGMAAPKTQVVTGGGDFNASQVASFAAASQLDAAGVDYQIVAITGPQSSGKSTLLNHVVRRLARAAWWQVACSTGRPAP